MKYHYLLLNLLCIGVSVKCLERNFPYVKTPLGGIKGYYKKSAEGRQYAAFESIPYAKPPSGELRFEPPVPVSPWSEDIEALSPPPECTQYGENVVGVEDCLYLNIYIPSINETKSMPVIFFIHGGAFQVGTSSRHGPKYLMDRDVILVTSNYRVGPLGFLSTGDEVVPGNMGLKDQSLALKMISENIQYFGGDPKRISLMGVSAGATSVHYHYLSPLSRGLFQNGISFSGSAVSHWGFTIDTAQPAKDLAAVLKCPTNNSLTMIQCLKSIPSDQFVAGVRGLMPYKGFSYVVFSPVAEKTNANYFINDTPANIIVNGKAYDVPWIAGIVKDEGIFKVAGFALDKNMVEYVDKNWRIISPYLLDAKYKIPEKKFLEITMKGKQHYFGNESFSTDMDSIKKLIHLVGDELIAFGVIKGVKLQARHNKSPVRLYHYTYRAAQSSSDRLSNSTIDFGVCHGDDVKLVLENPTIDPTTTAKDRAMLQDMLDFWVSYASTGEPDLGTPWPRLKGPSEKLHYMNIAGPQNFTMEANDNLAEEPFWRRVGV